MQARLGGAQGNVEGGRDLGQGQADVDMQDDEGATLVVEPPEGGIERIALDNLVLEIARVAEILDRQLHLDRAATFPAGKPETGAHGQAMRPGLEAIGIAKAGKIPPRPDQRLLDGIPGQLWIPKDEPGGPAEAPDQRAGEHGEGVMIAPLRALHE
jgi:hypothetical protein